MDSRGATNDSGAGGGRARGGEPKSKGDREDPEGPSGIDGAGDRGGDGDPED